MIQRNHIYHGNSEVVLQSFPDNTFHSIVTDPPYEIHFMQSNWDQTGIAYDVSFWKECLRVLKPGGHLISFSATSTYHRMASSIEEAGFEIRDKIDVFYDGNEDLQNFLMSLNSEQQRAFARILDQQSEVGLFSWVYGQGMPKGQNIRKAMQKAGVDDSEAMTWDGWYSGLKPSNEPICLARKPLSEKTLAGNTRRHHAGALNVDGCRIQRRSEDRYEYGVTGRQTSRTGESGIYGYYDATAYIPHENGRYPANVMLDETTSSILDEKSGIEASRFFFCAKATRKERDWEEPLWQIKSTLDDRTRSLLLMDLKAKKIDPYRDRKGAYWGYRERDIPDAWKYAFELSGEMGVIHNPHPTVKPLDLMRELVRLVTPSDGICLEPFAGSGTTLVACRLEHIDFVGVEQSEEFVDIAYRRLTALEKNNA